MNTDHPPTPEDVYNAEALAFQKMIDLATNLPPEITIPRPFVRNICGPGMCLTLDYKSNGTVKIHSQAQWDSELTRSLYRPACISIAMEYAEHHRRNVALLNPKGTVLYIARYGARNPAPEPPPTPIRDWMVTLQPAPGWCLYYHKGVFGHAHLYSDNVIDALHVTEQQANDLVEALTIASPHQAPYLRARPIP